MCMVVFFSEKMRLLPLSLLIANGLIGRHWPWWRIADLSSLGNVPSWKRARSVWLSSIRSNAWATGLRGTGSAAAGSAAASSSDTGTRDATSTASPLLFEPYFLDSHRKFCLRPLWWFRKSSGFYSRRPRHCPVVASSLVCVAAHEAYSSGRLSDGHITMKLNNNIHFIINIHNWQLWIKQYNTVCGRQCRAGAHKAMSGDKLAY